MHCTIDVYTHLVLMLVIIIHSVSCVDVKAGSQYMCIGATRVTKTTEPQVNNKTKNLWLMNVTTI